MSTVKKAVVLAAGLGTRLRPFTCATPKPLLPVWGEPMLARVVALLRERGVDDIVVNSHHLHEQVDAWVEAYRATAQAAGEGLRIRVSYEPKILGSGGVLNPLREWIGNEPFYLVNSDIVVENMPDLEKPFEKATTAATADGEVLGVALVTTEGPRTVEVEPESGFVTNWKSDEPGIDGTCTYCGFSILRADVLDYVEPTGFSSIVSAYEKAMMDGKFVKTVRGEDLLWEDAGTISSYIDLNRDGADNAFADIPQLKATGARDFEFLSSRGSERVFFGCDKGVVVLYDDATRTENGLYAGHARWLASKGIPVPEVVYDDPAAKTTVFANAGHEKKMSVDEYADVVKTLVKFNALGEWFRNAGREGTPGADCPALLPAFCGETWKWERDLFAEHCLGAYFGRSLPDAVRKELEGVAEMLEKEPKALVHRDFQSTNVLWKNGKPSVIDFQGMRLGPAAYDLASLVYDPYVKLTDRQRDALVALYAKESGRPEIEKVLPFAAVQRLVQCLGAYGRLASVGQPQFTRHIVPALQNLLDAADKAGLDATGALAEDLIAAATLPHRHEHGPDCDCHHE